MTRPKHEAEGEVMGAARAEVGVCNGENTKKRSSSNQTAQGELGKGIPSTPLSHRYGQGANHSYVQHRFMECRRRRRRRRKTTKNNDNYEEEKEE